MLKLITKGQMALEDVRENFRKDVEGATLIEYTVLIGLLTAAVVAVIVALGPWIAGKWETLQTAVGAGGA